MSMVFKKTAVIKKILIISALSLTAVGCSGLEVGNTYIGDSKVSAYAKTPSGWATETIQENPLFSLRSFGEPGLEVKDVMKPTNKLTGLIGRRAPDTEEPVALDILGKNLVFSDIDAAVESGEIRILSGPIEFSLDGKIANVMLYTVEAEGGTTKVKQVWAIDPVRGQAYGLAVGCSIDCFDSNEDTVDSIIESFAVG